MFRNEKTVLPSFLATCLCMFSTTSLKLSSRSNNCSARGHRRLAREGEKILFVINHESNMLPLVTAFES